MVCRIEIHPEVTTVHHNSRPGALGELHDGFATIAVSRDLHIRLDRRISEIHVHIPGPDPGIIRRGMRVFALVGIIGWLIIHGYSNSCIAEELQKPRNE